MKVVCIINKYNWLDLTTGKTYDVIDIYMAFDAYIIINDKGVKDWYPKIWFKPFAEIRNDKINKLLAE